MSISTFAELKAQIVDWSHRADLTARMDSFVDVAERELFRELMLRNIEASVSGTTSGSTISLPAGLSAFERIEIEANGYEYTLNYTSPNGLANLSGATNRPTRFVVEDGDIRLYSAPDGPYTYTIYYVPELTALVDDADSNWLLLNHSDLYLKAGLLQVAKFTKNQPDILRLTQEVAIALDSVKRADERKRFPVAGGLQIKPRSAR